MFMTRRKKKGAPRQQMGLDRRRAPVDLGDSSDRGAKITGQFSIRKRRSDGCNERSFGERQRQWPAYEIVDHSFDVVVVGAGGSGLRARSAAPRRAFAPPA